MPMRTPDGQPDISGIFTFRTLTPYQRPEQFAGKETLSAEEAAAFEASERRRQNRDLFDPEKGSGGYAPRSEGGVLSYNEFWYERGIDLTDDKRTALIIDPSDGRLPARVPRPPDPNRVQLTEKKAIARRYDSYENRSLMDRCIMASTRPADVVRRVQQQRYDLPDQGPRRDSQRDGAQRPGHPD